MCKCVREKGCVCKTVDAATKYIDPISFLEHTSGSLEFKNRRTCDSDLSITRF